MGFIEGHKTNPDKVEKDSKEIKRKEGECFRCGYSEFNISG